METETPPDEIRKLPEPDPAGDDGEHQMAATYDAAHAPRQRWWDILPLAGGGVLLLTLALVATGQLWHFITAGVEVLPLLILALLTSAGTRLHWARVVSGIWLVGSMIGLVVVSLGFAVGVALTSLPRRSAGLFTTPMPADTRTMVLMAAVAMPAIAIASLIWLWWDARVFATRWFSIDPDDRRHTIALVFLTDMVISALGLLAILRGSPPLLTLASKESAEQLAASSSSTDQLLALLYQLLWTVPLALIGAGLFTRRTLPQALRRLAIVVPTWQQALVGISMGLVLMAVSSLVDQAISSVWMAMQWPQTDTATFEKLLGSTLSPAGAVMIGLTAGLGEEVSIRGLLQPRFGLIGANLVFASAHAYQYGPDALLSVFFLGTVLGLVRARWNTTVSALAHGTFDCVAVLANYMGY